MKYTLSPGWGLQSGAVAAANTLFSLGSNEPGKWGDREANLAEALKRLDAAGISIVAVSAAYETAAVGIGRQNPFLNIVASASCNMPVTRLLHTTKQIERAAGRRFCRGPGGRPLDIDILDYHRLSIGHPASKPQRGSLVLPHPGVALRRFVLEPLSELQPFWRDPRTGAPLRTALARLPRPPGSITRHNGTAS